jgi:hypothetical protein
MNKGETIDDLTFDKLITNFDNKFRNSYEKQILNTKLLTHKCQFNCYNHNTSLLNAEDCARNCYKPMLMIKKNVTSLMENAKEKMEKCRVDKKIFLQASAMNYNIELRKCIRDYETNLNEMREEIEFIYEGYTKNFEKLIQENKGTEK